jgi:hypothetical protein
MRGSPVQALAFLVLGVSYWWLIRMVLQVGEPWDSPGYWIFAYPVSLLLSARAGRILGEQGWFAGVAITFAQLPVMWVYSGTGPLWLVGLVFLCLLSIPAAIASALTGWAASEARAGSAS